MKTIVESSLIFALIASAAGCGSGPAANAPSNSDAVRPAAVERTPTAVATAPPITPAPNAGTSAPANSTDASPAVSLDSPSEAYKAAYAIRQKKDVQALKQVMSKDMIAYFTEMGRRQQKSLDQTLALLVEQEQAPTAETRNERINGDRAVLEFKDASGKWLPMDFVKEDGAWKMTLSKAAAPRKGNAPAPKR